MFVSFKVDRLYTSSKNVAKNRQASNILRGTFHQASKLRPACAASAVARFRGALLLRAISFAGVASKYLVLGELLAPGECSAPHAYCKRVLS